MELTRTASPRDWGLLLNNTTAVQSTEESDLLDSLELGNWLKLPLVAVRELGPAALTLAWIHKRTSTSTFRALKNIIAGSEISLSVARKHLVKLHCEGWVTNRGREGRRTCTIELADTAKEAFAARKGYGVLPWWACCSHTVTVGRGKSRRQVQKRTFSWASQVMLSLVMAELMILKKVVDDDGPGLDAFDVWGSIADHLRGEDRFHFPVAETRQLTGLNHETIAKAKRDLAKQKVVGWRVADNTFGTHVLYPNEAFRIIKTDQGTGRFSLQFTTRDG